MPKDNEITFWKHVNEDTLRLLSQEDGFADYLQKLIQEEFDRRMEKALRALATGEKENAKNN